MSGNKSGKKKNEVLTEVDDHDEDEHEEEVGQQDDDDTDGGKDDEQGREEEEGQREEEDDRHKEHDEDEPEESEDQVLARRREERRERKRRRDEAIKRDKTELMFLRNQNDSLERRLAAVETSTQQGLVVSINERIQQARSDIQKAEHVLQAAMSKNNGEDTVKALRLRDQAKDRLAKLEYAQRRVQAAPQEEAQRQQQVDPRMRQHATRFIQEHTWYNPRGGDEDSSIVQALDASLMNEGYDPTSPEYWTELRKRVKRQLPHHFEESRGKGGGGQDEDRGKGPRMGSGRSSSNGKARQQVYISPERKQAMIEAGVWEDPKLRARYIKRYQEYDKVHKQNR